MILGFHQSPLKAHVQIHRSLQMYPLCSSSSLKHEYLLVVEFPCIVHEDGLSGDWLAAQGGVVGLADTEEGVVELSVVGVDVLLEEGIE